MALEIRKKGSTIVIVRKVPQDPKRPEVGYYRQTIGHLPVSCKDLDEADPVLTKALNSGERSQVSRYLAREYTSRADLLKRKVCVDRPTFNLDDDFRRKLEELCSQGYGPEIVYVTMEAAATSIPKFELEQEAAKGVWKAWDMLRTTLEDKGFTQHWYNLITKGKE